MSAPDIRRPEAIDAAWLSRALQSSGLKAEVADFTAAPVGSGQIGDSIRFNLTYARGAGPATMVGKFPSADPDSFNTGVMLGNYTREVMFYRHLAGSALIRTPHCLLADVEPATGEFVLLMEDLAPAQQGDQLRGVSLDEAERAIDEAAKLHASHWEDETLDDLPWVSGSRAAPPTAASPELVQGLWAAFVDRYNDHLRPEWIDIGARLSTRYPVLGELHRGPRCLTHNDFRPDNMMFGPAVVTTLDWQSFAFGSGAQDVAYFLAGGLGPELRRQHEPRLLDLYLAGLRAHGVEGYSRDDLVTDYGRGGFLLFLTAFFAAMVVKRTERGDAMFIQMLGGASQHILDHDALAVLG